MKTFARSVFQVAVVIAIGFAYLMMDAQGNARRELERRIEALQMELLSYPECKCSGQPREVSIEERVLELPDDGDTWHTILFLHPDWQKRRDERRAEAMFESDSLLVSLRVQTHWHCITTDQQEFKKFSKLVDALPCLVVERANGQVVYRESGPDLGKRPHGLVHAIRKEIQRHCPDGKCLPIHPVRDAPEPAPADEVPAVLKDEPKVEPPKRISVMPLAVVMSLGGFLGFGIKFRAAAGV